MAVGCKRVCNFCKRKCELNTHNENENDHNCNTVGHWYQVFSGNYI